MEPKFVEQAKELQATLERDQMRTFVDRKAASAFSDPQEAMVWKFLRLLWVEV